MSIFSNTEIEPDRNPFDTAPPALASVLVIDDEEMVCGTVKALLEAEGFEVVTALRGEEGVELLRARQFEVVISDLVMPGMNGIRTIAALKEVDPGVEVIILTGYASVESSIGAFRQGACDFLLKPIGMKQLRPALKRALEKRRPKAALPLYEASRTVLATLDSEDLIPTVLDVAEHSMRASSVALALSPSDGTELRIDLSRDDGPLTKAAVKRLAQQAMQARVPLFDPSSVARCSQGYVAALGAGSVLIYLLEVHQALLGVLVLWRDPGVAKFSAFDVERGGLLADEIVIALDNARLYHILSYKVEELEAAKVTVARSEARARRVMEAAQEAIILLDKQGVVWDLNPKAVEMLGWARDQTVGRNLADFAISPRLLDSFRKHLETAFREGKDPLNGCLEVYALRQNGEEFPIEISTAVIETPQGKLLSTFARDITNRKRAEDALRVSENRYRGLFERNMAGVLSCTREGRILDCNESLALILGYDSPGELLGTDVRELWGDPSGREEMIARLSEQGSLSNYEVHYRRRDGKPVWALLTIHQIEPKGGEGSILEGTLVDITQRKQAEKRLLLTQFSIDHASDAVAWLDPSGRIVYVNEAACRSLGRPREELLSLEIADIDPDFPPGAWEVAWERIQMAGSMTFEARRITKLGQVFPVEVTANYVEFGGEEYSFTFSRDITQRKESERQINLQITALESAANGIVITDQKGLILWANPAFTRLTGYAVSEVVGQSLRVLKSGAHDAAFYQKLWNSVSAGEVWQGEVINRRKDGTLYTEEMTITPVRDGNGVVTHFIAIKQDITERKRAEAELMRYAKDLGVAKVALEEHAQQLARLVEELARERDLLGTLMDTLPDYIYCKDRQSRFLRTNPAHAKTLGLSDPCQAIGKTDFDFFPAEDAKGYSSDEKQVMEAGQPLIGHIERVRKPDGQLLWCSTTKMPTRDTQGRVTGLVGITRDITERKQAEEKLRDSEERYRELFENASDIVYTTGLGTRLTSLNRVGRQILGYSAEEATQLDLRQLVAPKDWELIKLSRERLMAGVSDFTIEVGVTTKDGRAMTLEVKPRLICKGGEPVGVQGIARDITGRDAAEMELRQAQKLESVGRLASGIAHEVNTPIQFVGDNTRFLQDSFAELQTLYRKYQDLRDAAGSGAVNPELLAAVCRAEKASDCAYLLEEIPRALTQTLDGVNRVASIVRAMKEFAHPEGKEMAASDLNQAILSTLTVARNELKYVADVETDLGDLPLVVCNIGDLNQVFLNLLVNAAHAIGEVVNGTGGKGTIRVRTVREGRTVLVAIADTGAGIPEAIRSRIFDPFFTTKKVGRGTGQGLAIARSVVVDRHKGTLTFESVVGKGTTFCVRLPIDPGERSKEVRAP